MRDAYLSRCLMLMCQADPDRPRQRRKVDIAPGSRRSDGFKRHDGWPQRRLYVWRGQHVDAARIEDKQRRVKGHVVRRKRTLRKIVEDEPASFVARRKDGMNLSFDPAPGRPSRGCHSRAPCAGRWPARRIGATPRIWRWRNPRSRQIRSQRSTTASTTGRRRPIARHRSCSGWRN